MSRMTLNRSVTSLIEDQEEQEAQNLVKEHLTFEPIVAFNRRIAVKIYLRPEEISTFTTDDGREVSIYMPPQVCAHDRFKSCTALVISVGKDCYQDEKYKDCGPYCKVGDWVLIPRNMGTQVNFRGVPVQLIPEDAIYCVLEDPTHIQNVKRSNYV